MTLLRSIPGIGPVLSAHLSATTHAFEHTPTARQLAAYVGIRPSFWVFLEKVFSVGFLVLK